MSIIYSPLNLEIKCSRENYYNIVVEDKRAFNLLVNDLYTAIDKDDSKFIVSSEDKNFFSNSTIISSIRDLDLTENKFIKKLFKDIEVDINNYDLINQFNKVKESIINLMDDYNVNSEYNLEYDCEFSVESILKIIKVKLEEYGSTFIERLLNYISVSKKLTSVVNYFIINMDAYLLEDDYREIIKLAKYLELNVFFLSSYRETNACLENTIIFDKDFCKIY